MIIQSKKSLARILDVSKGELDSILSNLDQYYYSFQRKKPKPDGTFKIRTFEPSKGLLKAIQRRLLTRVLENIPLRDNVYGGVKKRSNIHNAKPHKGKKYHFETDLKDFFPSITNKVVFETLRAFGFSTDVASIITQLTTYKGHVPQGIPTSTCIANLVFTSVDDQLIKICTCHKITYTRYIDDLTFSSQSDFQGITKSLLQEILNGGFRISQRKTFYKLGTVNVTGIDVPNNKLDLPESMKKKATEKNANPGLYSYYQQIKKIDKKRSA